MLAQLTELSEALLTCSRRVVKDVIEDTDEQPHGEFIGEGPDGP